MSNHLTSLAYKADVGSLLRKSVLVLLTDKASDDGSGIWASKQTMADELCCSKRAVINTLQEFMAEGLLSPTGKRDNPNGYTVTYTINVDVLERLPKVKRWAVDQVTPCTGEQDAPVHEDHGRGAPGAPKPPLNPPLASEAKASSAKRARKRDQFPAPDGVPESVWSDFLASPKRRKAGMSDTAYIGVCNNLRDLAEHGFPPGKMVALAVERGWVTVKRKWVEDDERSQTNRGNNQRMGRHQSSDGLSPTTRAALDVFGPN